MTRMCNHFKFKNEISHFFTRMLHKIKTDKMYMYHAIGERDGFL